MADPRSAPEASPSRRGEGNRLSRGNQRGNRRVEGGRSMRLNISAPCRPWGRGGNAGATSLRGMPGPRRRSALGRGPRHSPPCRLLPPQRRYRQLRWTI